MEKLRLLTFLKFKKGKEKEAIQFFQKEVTPHALQCGSNSIQYMVSENDPAYLVVQSDWPSLEQFNTFRSKGDSWMQQISHCFAEDPRREFFKIIASFPQK